MDRYLLGMCWLVVAAAFFSMRGLDIPSDPAGPFMLRYLAAAAAWLVACGIIWRRPPIGPRGVGSILVGAALLRVVAWSVPILLETDHHRYLWDGSVVAAGLNPYQFSPAEVVAERAGETKWLYRDDEAATLRQVAAVADNPAIRVHLDQVNHPEIPTCYPPLTEFFFAVPSALAPGQIGAWKLSVALIDFGVCVAVWLLLCCLGRPPAWVLFYAWCPLPLKEYANTGHFDPLATLLTVLAIVALVKHRRGTGGALLGLGVAAKLYPLVLYPVLWRRLGRRGLATACTVPALLLVPFLEIGLHVFDGLFAFAKDWEFNSSIFAAVNALVEQPGAPSWKLSTYVRLSQTGDDLVVGDYLQELTLDGFLLSKVITGAVLVVILVALARWREDADWSVPGRALVALTALFCLAPVADPWYLPWLLPYAACFPALCWGYLGTSAVCYYAYFLAWKYPVWQRPVEYIPFYLLAVWEMRSGMVAYLTREESSEGPSEPKVGQEPDRADG